MVRMYESKPIEKNHACMEMAGELAGRPFSNCKDCKFMSNMTCSAKSEKFAENAKKALHFV